MGLFVSLRSKQEGISFRGENDKQNSYTINNQRAGWDGIDGRGLGFLFVSFELEMDIYLKYLVFRGYYLLREAGVLASTYTLFIIVSVMLTLCSFPFYLSLSISLSTSRFCF